MEARWEILGIPCCINMSPCRYQSAGSPTHMEDSTVQALVRRQLTPEYQQDSASRGTRESSTGTIDPSQQATPSSQGGTTSSQETTGTSVGTGSSRRGRHPRGSKYAGGVATNTDSSLSISGVMPRQTELPSPSSSHLVNRVFKVIFLGEGISGLAG